MPGRKFYGQLSNRKTFAGLLPKKILPGKCRAEILPGSFKAGMARTFQNTSYGYNSSCTSKYNSSCTHEEFFDFDQTKSNHLICIKWLCKNAKRNHLFVKREKTKDKRQTRTEEKEKETILQRMRPQPPQIWLFEWNRTFTRRVRAVREEVLERGLKLHGCIKGLRRAHRPDWYLEPKWLRWRLGCVLWFIPHDELERSLFLKERRSNIKTGRHKGVKA